MNIYDEISAEISKIKIVAKREKTLGKIFSESLKFNSYN